jgi:predicted nuclease of restriction endonuclease-like (RecB) superfamily
MAKNNKLSTKNKTSLSVNKQDKQFFAEIAAIIIEARKTAYKAVNTTMIQTNWFIGKRIIENEQKGKIRADYGEFIIVNLSRYLTDILGRGFSEANLRNFRQFYLTFPKGIEMALNEFDSRKLANSKKSTNKSQFASSKLANLGNISWTHWCALMRIDDEAEQCFYINETIEQNWDVKFLERNIRSGYYRRLLSTQNKSKTKNVSKTSEKNAKQLDFVKDPYILEFLDVPEDIKGKETLLETAIINNLQSFMLELGKGFTFYARQFRISTETTHNYLDLVFYNYLLKCFVIIDLKTAKLSAQDVGQMEMYVRMFDALKKGEDDNPTLGIILCTEKDETVVRYSVLIENKQIFASKYKTILPTEKQLAAMIEKKNIKLLHDDLWQKSILKKTS